MSAQSSAPLVTVITATFNSSATLKCALESLLDQDLTDFEAWIVGDACTDDSAEVVAGFGDPRLHWTNLPCNSGSQGAPNNEGLRRARGRYIAYLGHDDLWWPQHLSGLVSFIEQTGADLVHSLTAMLTPSGLELPIDGPGAGRTYEDHFTPPSSWLHRREIFADCGWWGDHRQLSRGVDHDYLRRMYLAGKRIVGCPQVTLLKFPSPRWGTYALTSGHPQSRYLHALQDDPEKLQWEILLEWATMLAQQQNPSWPIRQIWSRAFHASCRRLIDVYGRDRWPLSTILFRKFQRQRPRTRRLRGLPPDHPPNPSPDQL